MEGGTENDWSAWEKQNAKRLASAARKREWPDYILKNYPNPLQEENYISGRAADHYHRYEEDFDCARRLGHNAHRFSIEWSRVEPQEGKFDEKEIGHYQNVVRALRARGLEPFVTLSHWTVPRWFRDKDGWLNKESPRYFERYVQKIVSALPDVRYWLTLNEPDVYSMNAYMRGLWPPQRKGLLSYWRASHRLIEAHLRAYKAIKNNNSGAQVGIAKDNVHFEAVGWNPWNLALKSFADYFWNHYFLNRIAHAQDFIGLNFYFHNRINWWFRKNENKSVSDMGWELYPESFYCVLMDLKRYGKPVYITENGLADADDSRRAEFIRAHIATMKRAMDDGADVRGYFHWSLIDNFEWDKGFWPRFGLIEVDYRTLARRVRPSALAYQSMIEHLRA